MLGFAVVVYFPLMSQKLTNTFDGLWMDTYYIAGGWELSIGRWLWPLADALRFGVQTDPINSLLTLSLVTLSFILVRRLFTTKDSFLTYLLGMAFISSASVSIQLSYRYMSPIFGLSLFLSVAAAYCVIRTENKVRAVVQGTVCLTLSLGLYQANLGSFCLILLVYFLMLLFQKPDRSLIHGHIAKSLCSAAAGVVLYYLTLKISDPEDRFADYGLSDVRIQRSCECFTALCFKAAAHRSSKGIPDLWDLFFSEPVSEQYSAGHGLFCADRFAGRIRAVKTLLAGRPEQRPGIHFAERCGVGSAAGNMQCDVVDYQRSNLASADGRGTGSVYPSVHLASGCDPEGTASK